LSAAKDFQFLYAKARRPEEEKLQTLGPSRLIIVRQGRSFAALRMTKRKKKRKKTAN
jgi:hypothetical protein